MKKYINFYVLLFISSLTFAKGNDTVNSLIKSDFSYSHKIMNNYLKNGNMKHNYLNSGYLVNYSNNNYARSNYSNNNFLDNVSKLAISESGTARSYDDDDFNVFLFYVRRGEVITLGAFPFVFLISQMVYDVTKYAILSAKGSSEAYNYTPFSSSNRHKLKEEVGLIVTSLSISVVIAIIDTILISKEVKKLKNKGKTYDYFIKD